MLSAVEKVALALGMVLFVIAIVPADSISKDKADRPTCDTSRMKAIMMKGCRPFKRSVQHVSSSSSNRDDQAFPFFPIQKIFGLDGIFGGQKKAKTETGTGRKTRNWDRKKRNLPSAFVDKCCTIGCSEVDVYQNFSMYC